GSHGQLGAGRGGRRGRTGCGIGAAFFLEEARGALHAFGQPALVHGLQQVVQGFQPEGFHGVLVVGRDEDEMRQDGAVFPQPAHHAHAIQARHVDVQKYQLGLQLLDDLDGLETIGTSGDNFDFGEVFQQERELVAGELFIIHDNGRKYGRRTVAHGVGIIAFRLKGDRILPNPDNVQIAPAEGKLGVLIPGMGAVTTTFIAGLEAIKRSLGKPIGSLTQLGTVRLGKRTEGRSPAIKDFVPLAGIEDIEVGCWDIFDDNAYEAAVKAGVLEMTLLEKLKEPLSAVKPMRAVFDQKFVKRLNGPNVMSGGSKMEYAERVMDDIRQFKQRTGVSRLTMIWCGSTEVYHEPAAVHATLKDFECGLQKDDPEISPSQIYAYAALKSGVAYANGAPHLTTDMPALLELARNMNLPVAGKDYKSGQTFMKTLIAPGLKSRM